MKKIVILFLIGMITSQVLFANDKSILVPKPDVIITIKINLHSKKQNCNSGFGFCDISIKITFEDKTVPGTETINGKAYINTQNQLIIKLNEADLKNYYNGESLNYLSGKKSVYIDADYELTNEVTKALGSPKPIIIKEGNYPVSLDQGIYTLSIAL